MRPTLLLAASAERYSEHPRAQALRTAAAEQALTLAAPDAFTAFPGIGVQATVNQHRIEVGNRRLVAVTSPAAAAPEAECKTLLYMACDGAPAAIFAAADTLRDEVPAALRQLRMLGITHIELLTGDNVRTASALADRLGIAYRAELLPSTPSPRLGRSRRSASPDAIFRRSCGGYRRRPHMMIATPTMSIASPRMS